MKVNAQNLLFLSDLVNKEQLLNDEELKLISDLTKNDFFCLPACAMLSIICQISHQGTKTTKYLHFVYLWKPLINAAL